MRLQPTRLDITLKLFRPDVVGLTALYSHVRASMGICKRAKELLPGCRTIAGGHHATLLPEDFFEPVVDYVAVGEGIQPFRALLRQLESSHQAEIPGIWRRNPDAGRFEFGGTPLTFKIDELPPPDRSL